MKVNYTYKQESDIDKFTFNNSIIELKEYQNDLVFYSPMNSYKAEFALYDKSSNYEEEPKIYSGGPFGQYLKISEDMTFDVNNFNVIDNNARISFYLGSNILTNLSTYKLTKNSNFTDDALPAGTYSLTVTVDGEPTSSLVLKCSNGATVKSLKNKMLYELDGNYPFEVNIANTESDCIVLQPKESGKCMKLTNGTTGTDLLTYFDVNTVDYGSAPEEEIKVLQLFNLSIYHYRNTEDGSAKSYLKFILSGDEDQEVEIPWNNNTIDLDNIEIDFDNNVMYIFINGELKKVEILTNKFAKNDNGLTLFGNSSYPYSFDEVIVNKRCLHTTDFELPKYPLTRYSKEKPYIDFYFPVEQLKLGMELTTASTNNIHCCVCDDGNFYYHNAGAWRRCNGDFNGTNDWYSFCEKIKDFDFSGDDLFIRCYFFSNGTENAYLSVPYFEMDDELYEDKEGNTPAILIGKELDYADVDGKKLVISTDVGTTNIDFSAPSSSEDSQDEGSSDESDESSNESFLNLDDIVQQISDLYPDGILKCYKDSKNRIVLISENKGDDAYIAVSGNAAGILFDESFSKGTNMDTGSIDYTKFYEAVRTYTDKKLISETEVSNDQMRLYLKEALAYYKKWRATDENTYTCQLKGDWETGYEIPSVIESKKDIVDIYFMPIFPITFYANDFCDGNNENVFSLAIAQSLFGRVGSIRGATNVSSDFYISLMGIQDFKQTLGLDPKWEILNNRIQIYPKYVSRFTKVSIKYKAKISEEECLEDPDIIKYVHGKCLMTIGNVRGQYGGVLSAGEATLNMNSGDLYTRGKEFIAEVMAEWKSQQPALGFIMG